MLDTAEDLPGVLPVPEVVDLAALVLQPADLEAEGQPGYGAAYGWTMTTVEEMVSPDAFLESRIWMNPATIPNAAAMFNQAGWLRYHEMMLATPEDPANPDDGRIWFITGAGRGLGVDIAKATISETGFPKRSAWRSW